MKVSMNKKYTSNDSPMMIVCINHPDSSYPVIALDNENRVHFFTEDGKSMFGDKFNLVEMYEPKEEEWCLFWQDFDRGDIDLGMIDIHIGKFIGMNGLYYQSANGDSWDNCMDFNGELPECIKKAIKRKVI
jgi:hypothetical protein